MMMKKEIKIRNLLLIGVEEEAEVEEEVEVVEVEVVKVQVMMGQVEAVLVEGRDQKSRKKRKKNLLNQIKTMEPIHRLQQLPKPIHSL